MTDPTPTPPAAESRPAETLRERVAERIRHDSFVRSGLKPAQIEGSPWATLRDGLRGQWLGYADSALAVLDLHRGAALVERVREALEDPLTQLGVLEDTRDLDEHGLVNGSPEETRATAPDVDRTLARVAVKAVFGHLPTMLERD
jgi:hypothetical protein